MDSLQAMDRRKVELLEARFAGSRVSDVCSMEGVDWELGYERSEVLGLGMHRGGDDTGRIGREGGVDGLTEFEVGMDRDRDWNRRSVTETETETETETGAGERWTARCRAEVVLILLWDIDTMSRKTRSNMAERGLVILGRKTHVLGKIIRWLLFVMSFLAFFSHVA